MQTLFPELKPHREFTLERGRHRVHVEESGNSAGIPILLIHDGPGASIDPVQARLLNAERFRIIQFDQRGCGKSTPLAEIRENTLAELISDMQAIRLYLGVEQWLVCGHGWGATLALAYGQKCPEALSGLILSSIFLGRQQDICWAFGDGAANFFPDAWKEFVAQAPSHKTDDVLAHYHERLSAQNDFQQLQAGRQWARWESSVQGMHSCQDLSERLQHPHVAVSLARLSCHYLLNQCFLDERPLLQNMVTVESVRAILVHGRFEVISPQKSSYHVHKRWPSSQLYIVRDGSHSLRDSAMTDAVMRAISVMGEFVAGDEGPVAE
jgi:proline iminopeptidase